MWMSVIWKKSSVSSGVITAPACVSIIVPFRNEASNLAVLIDCLENQLVDKRNLEIIFVNDHSNDGGEKSITNSLSHKVISLEENSGKKAALSEGIHAAKHEWIITIDADVILGPKWLTAIRGAMETFDCDMIILPLFIDDGKTTFEKMQCIEFMSLLGTTAAMATAGMPILCNGANLAFKKSAWIEMSLKRDDDSISSGDDMFLMHALKKNGKIKWLHNIEAIAVTAASPNFSEFIAQRIRWTTKSLQYKDISTILTGTLVAVINIALLTILFLGIVDHKYLLLYGVSFLLKMLVDFTLIKQVAAWTDKKHLLICILPVSLIYPLYAVLIPVVGFFYHPKWKGRTISLRQQRKR